jgi:hypothetical protein
MKNLFFVIVSVLLLTISHNTNAQEVENDKTNENVNFLQFYDNEMFHWSINTIGRLTLNYGNENWNVNAYKVNINNEIIRNALLKYPDSAQAYNSYRKNAITGNIVYWSGLVLILSSLIPLYTIDDEKLSYDLYRGMIIGGATITFMSIFNFFSAQSNLYNAVNIFNRNKARELNR